MSPHRIRRTLIPIAMAASLALGACATGDEPEATETTESAEPTTEASPTAGSEVEVTAEDYSFEGIPETIEAGSKLALQNASDKEAHEIVAFRLPDTETRPVADIFKLPEAELNAALGVPPTTVVIAMPQEDGMAVLGDGTLNDAGRYAFACFIPTGADPQEYLRAAQQSGDEAPVVEGGPPHFTQGMFAEAKVE
ncbi:MAG TPA: hypothetical protein VEU28_05335 [Actinomycetota bacterium]|nr:hypothetical protein [Actinomycetota bacterium]